MTDSEQVKAQAQIREKIEKALASGEIKKSTESGSGSGSASTPSAGEKHPASNWSDDEEEDNEEEVEEKERSSKKMKTA